MQHFSAAVAPLAAKATTATTISLLGVASRTADRLGYEILI